jgi:hypothetical protein
MCQHKFEGPPSLSAKVVRNLGANFCNMSEDDLSDKMLKKKKNLQDVSAPKSQERKTKMTRKRTMKMKTSNVMVMHWVGRFCMPLIGWAFWSVLLWRICLTVVVLNFMFIGRITMSFIDRYFITHPVIGLGFTIANEPGSFLHE